MASKLPDRLDRLEDALIRFTEQNNQLLTRVVEVQEAQQHQLIDLKQVLEQVLGHVQTLYTQIKVLNIEIKALNQDIKGLRRESLRIQRHIFGDEVDK